MEKAPTKRQHSAPEYLERRKQGKSESSLKARLRKARKSDMMSPKEVRISISEKIVRLFFYSKSQQRTMILAYRSFVPYKISFRFTLPSFSPFLLPYPARHVQICPPHSQLTLRIAPTTPRTALSLKRRQMRPNEITRI